MKDRKRIIRAIELCLVCKKAITAKRNKFFCSRQCNAKHQHSLPREVKPCNNCGKKFHRAASSFARYKKYYCSRKCRADDIRGKSKGEAFKETLRRASYWKGRHLPDEMRRKISETRRRLKITPPSGMSSPLWKGGKLGWNRIMRNRKEYRVWREAVFTRDNWTCINCGLRSRVGLGKTVILNADHIKPFAYFPALRFEISNGRTLCVPCHKEIGFKGRNYEYEKLQA